MEVSLKVNREFAGIEEGKSLKSESILGCED